MLRQNLPEFLGAVVLSMFLLLGYSMRDNRDPASIHTPRPTPRVRARFLLELEVGGRGLRVLPDGAVEGKRRLTESEWLDLRKLVSELRAPGPGGKARLRFYSEQRVEELSFEASQPPTEVARVLEQLRLLEVWP